MLYIIKFFRKESFFSILVVLMALIHVYKPSSIAISYGEILLFVCCPIYCRQCLNFRFPLAKQELGFVFFLIYLIVSSMIFGIIFDAPYSKLFSVARVCFYWFLIFFLGKNLFDKKTFEKWMIIFSVALSLYIIIQFFVYISIGYYIPGLILGLSINNGGTDGLAMYNHILNAASYASFRPHGFLAEPAQSCHFLFISIITLICNKSIVFKKKFLLVILFSIATIITQSTTGIILLVFAWFLFITIEKQLSVYRVPLIIAFIVVCLYFLFGIEKTELSSIQRVVSIVNGSGIDASSDARLNNGLNLFKELPFIYKIFGTGMGLFEYSTGMFGFLNPDYCMNAFSAILFYTGFIGFGIWIISLIMMFLTSELFGKICVIGLFIMSLGGGIFCQPQMVWFFLLILADIKEKNDRYSSAKLQ